MLDGLPAVSGCQQFFQPMYSLSKKASNDPYALQVHP